MKKTPLRRKTPLRAKRPVDRAGRPLRRAAIKPKARAADDRVTPEDAAYVFKRDGECVLAKFERLGLLRPHHHQCLNEWGDPLRPGDRLSIEHVKEQPMLGDRAPSDRRHMVAACPGSNWLTYEVEKFRWVILQYLAEVESST